MNGIFIISLDFELHWGGVEKWPLRGKRSYRDYFLNTREVIPEMLKLFQKYGIHVTWAAVGILLHRSKKEFTENVPSILPEYKVAELSAYNYIRSVGIGEDEHDDPFHFAPSLVDRILSTPHQELGTHTFAHYYCNEAGQTVTQFRADLQAAQSVAKKYGHTVRSLVFPRNQFKDEYLKVCFEEGITSVRSNPRDWFWNIDSTQDEGMWKRLNRGLDAYFPIGTKNTFSLSSVEVRDGYPLCIPASRLLRPYRPNEFFLNRLKINRIKEEMQHAAKFGETYHLWWHPHNFGYYPQQSLDALEEILKSFQYNAQKSGIQSLTMQEFVQQRMLL